MGMGIFLKGSFAPNELIEMFPRSRNPYLKEDPKKEQEEVSEREARKMGGGISSGATRALQVPPN